MQLKLYAKYTDVSRVVQNEADNVYAVCESELDDNFYLKKGEKTHEVISFLVVTLLVPILSTIVTATIVRSLYKSIQVRAIKKANHQNVAALVLTGMFVTFSIVGCDIAAVYFACSMKHEMNNIHTLNILNIVSTVSLLVCDGLASLLPLTVLLYLYCKHISEELSEEKRCIKYFLQFCQYQFSIYFQVIFGSKKQEKMWWKEKGSTVSNYRLVWILLLCLVSPLFAINSHITFVLVSWLTDGMMASSVALIGLAVLVYYFFIFRQCYTSNAKIKDTICSKCWNVFLPLYPMVQCLKFAGGFFYRLFCCYKCKECSDRVESDDTALEELIDFTNERFDRGTDNEELNTKAFCVVFMWGWILVISVILLLFAFIELPIVTFNLLSDILNTFQVSILLISLLITYKILSINEPDLYRFLHNLRATFLNRSVARKVNDLKDVDDVEAAGSIMGELAEVVIHKLPAAEN